MRAGLAGFTGAVAEETGRYDFRPNCDSMGTTETPRTEEMLAEGPRETVLEQYALNRLGRPEDAAAMVTFLASDAAEWITGAAVPVNGGYTMAWPADPDTVPRSARRGTGERSGLRATHTA